MTGGYTSQPPPGSVVTAVAFRVGADRSIPGADLHDL